MRALLLTVLLACLPLVAGCEPKEEPVSSVTGNYEVTNVFPRVQLRLALKNVETGETFDEVFVQPYRGSCAMGKELLGAKHALTVTTYRHASGLLIHRIDNSRPLCGGSTEEPISSVTGAYKVTNVFPRGALRVALRNSKTGETFDDVYVQLYKNSCSLGRELLGAKHTLTVTTYRQASGLRVQRIDNSRPLCEGKFW